DGVEFPGLSTTGFTGTGVVDSASPYVSNTYTITTANTTAPSSRAINVFDNAGNLTQEIVTFVRDTTAPSGQSISLVGGPSYSALSIPLSVAWGSDSEAGLDVSTEVVQRASSTLTGGICGTFGGWGPVTLSSGADTTVAWNNCYRYRLVVSD